MFLVMLKESFLRSRRRKTLAVVNIFFAASLITALMNISIDVGDKMAQELKSYGANISVVPKSEDIPLEIGGINYNPLKGQVFLEEKDLPRIKDIFWQNNITGFAPFLKVMAEIKGTERNVQITGTYFDKHLPAEDDNDFHTGVKIINPFWKVDGKWPEDDDQRSVLVGAELAEDMSLKAGDRIKIHYECGKQNVDCGTKSLKSEMRNPVYVIKGILSTGGAEDNGIVAPLAAVQKLAGLEGKIQSASISALTIPEDMLSRKARRDPDALSAEEYDRWYCKSYVSSISHQIEEAVLNSSARPVWQVAASEGAVINKIQLLMIVMTIAAFIASGLGISSLMSTTIMERSREIGLMKALGASDHDVYLLFLSEAVIVGVIGGLLGFAVGSGLSQVISLSIFESTVSFNPVVPPIVIVISIVIALAGSIMPSRLITRLHPTEVLHGR